MLYYKEVRINRMNLISSGEVPPQPLSALTGLISRHLTSSLDEEEAETTPIPLHPRK
jgi:hypothetical protein